MTNDQKTQIEKLRLEGYGYATIADALGLTKSQVSSFCRRNKLSGIKSGSGHSIAPNIDVCRCCGKPLTQIPGRKTLKFCSNECRMKWWNSHLDQVNKKAIYNFTCAYCGKEFTAYGNKGRKYCSHECYITDRFYDDNRAVSKRDAVSSKHESL